MRIFKTRKEQIENDFYVAIVRQLKADGDNVSARARKVIRGELRDAAMVGAAEERSRTLGIISVVSDLGHLAKAITGQSVLRVLGYEKGKQ